MEHVVRLLAYPTPDLIGPHLSLFFSLHLTSPPLAPLANRCLRPPSLLSRGGNLSPTLLVGPKLIYIPNRPPRQRQTRCCRRRFFLLGTSLLVAGTSSMSLYLVAAPSAMFRLKDLAVLIRIIARKRLMSTLTLRGSGCIQCSATDTVKFTV